MANLSYIINRLKPFFLFFIIIELVTRIALSIYAAADISGSGAMLPVSLLIGFIFDVAVFTYLAIPVALISLAIPQKAQSQKIGRMITAALFFIFTFALMFCSVGEGFFWDEFQSRYNFIAVDYLVYTNEVIGNIRESYPVNQLMAGMAVIGP